MDTLSLLNTSFEDIKHVQGEFEFWTARELMPVLGYKKWERFMDVISRAQNSCKTSEKPIGEHFSPAPGKTSLSQGGRPKEDFLLTRYACYLIAQNGDPRKIEIAQAQAYFATQTRRQELYQQRIVEDKRLSARKKLKETESKIEETIYQRGVSNPLDFATFKNKKIEALYQMSIHDLKEKRKIPSTRALADFDSEVELKAKDFIYAMTDHNIHEKNLQGKDRLGQELVDNATSTRQTLVERGIVPESLPPQEDLKLVEKRRGKTSQNLTEKQGKPLRKKPSIND